MFFDKSRDRKKEKTKIILHVTGFVKEPHIVFEVDFVILKHYFL